MAQPYLGLGRILVIIPTFNEIENIDMITSRLRAAVPEAHILIADDNSPDGTGKRADELAATDEHIHVVHRQGKEGLGKAYLDACGGAAVSCLGHAHPDVLAAMHAQIDKLITASFNMVNYESTLQWAERISEVAPGELSSTFFSNGGAEATDGALKLAKADPEALDRKSVV
mgnify:CR=1 FL=1